MSAPGSSVDHTTEAPPPCSSVSWPSKLFGALTPLLVFSAIGGAAYWGHVSAWTFSGTPVESKHIAAEATEVRRPTVRASGGVTTITFDSAAEVDAAGIEITPAWQVPLTEQISAAGEVAFDPTRVARISSRASGFAFRVLKRLGEPVAEGEVLALIDSSDVGRAKADLQQAVVRVRLRQSNRDGAALAKGALSGTVLREAEAALKEAQVSLHAAVQRLANLGLAVRPEDYHALAPSEVSDRLRRLGLDDLSSALIPSEASTNLYPLRSPFAGVVLSADCVGGEVVEAGKPLIVVADPSRVLVNLHVAAADARRAQLGQRAFFRPDGDAAEYSGQVTWVGSTADEVTRTVPIQVHAANPTGALRPGTLGRGRLVIRELPSALVVPNGSVHRFLNETVVFVRAANYLEAGGPKMFAARAVKLGAHDENNTEIRAGLAAGEIVATKRSAALVEELNRASRPR